MVYLFDEGVFGIYLEVMRKGNNMIWMFFKMFKFLRFLEVRI